MKKIKENKMSGGWTPEHHPFWQRYYNSNCIDLPEKRVAADNLPL